MSVTKIALVGCGRIAWQLEHDPLRYKPCTHLGTIRHLQQRDRNLQIAAFCDSRVENASLAAKFAVAPDATITDNYDHVIRAKPDLLVIASGTESHSEILTAAVRSRIPRIIVEKPVAISEAETRKLRRLVQSGNSVILPNYERRYHPKYLALREKITGAGSYRGFFAAGGKILYRNTRNGDEGVLLHDTTHLLDLAQFFFGRVKKHKCIAGRRRHLLSLEHDNGSTGVIETILGIGVFHLELEIHTAKARLTVGNGFLKTEKIQASPHYKSFHSYGAPTSVADKKFPVARNPFVQLYHRAIYGRPDNEHFLDALQNAEILSLL